MKNFRRLISSSVFILTAAEALAITPKPMELTPLPPVIIPTCAHVIVFKKNGELKGDWAEQMDNMAEYVNFDNSTKFMAKFYVATEDEVEVTKRKHQEIEILRQLKRRGINLEKIEFQVLKPKSSDFRTEFLPFVMYMSVVDEKKSKNSTGLPICAPAYPWPAKN